MVYNVLEIRWRLRINDAEHRSVTPKFVTPTALSCIDNSWRSTTLSPPKKLTSSTANLEWCDVHFICDSYSTFIRRVIGPSKNSMELFCKAKFDFKSTWNRDSATSHHKHPVCQSPVGDAEKLTNVWSRSGLEGFGRYPVFTAVNTGKYRPGKNRFWTPKVGKTGKNTSTGK